MTDCDFEERAAGIVENLLGDPAELMDFLDDKIHSLFRGDPLLDSGDEETEESDEAYERFVDLETLGEKALRLLIIEKLVGEVKNGRKNAGRESHPSHQLWPRG